MTVPHNPVYGAAMPDLRALTGRCGSKSQSGSKSQWRFRLTEPNQPDEKTGGRPLGGRL